MSTFTKADATRLLDLLELEVKIYEQMLQLTQEQEKLLAADEIEAFDKSLDSRQRLIERINGLHQEPDALMQSYHSFSDGNGGRKIAAIEKAAVQVRELLLKCSQLNEKNKGQAMEKSQGYSSRIDELSLKRKSLGSYMQNVDNNSDLFDKRM